MSLPRYARKRVAPIGRAAKRKAPGRAQAYAAVARRAKGTCELDGTRQDLLDPHHVFGRHMPGVPDAVLELPEMLFGVCRRCHDHVTGLPGLGIDEGLDDAAKHKAIARFCERFDEEYDYLAPDMDDELRRIIRETEKTSALTSFVRGV